MVRGQLSTPKSRRLSPARAAGALIILDSNSKFTLGLTHARGGIVPLPAGLKESGWLRYVLVNDVAATVEKVMAAEGEVLVKPDARLQDGNVALIADPLGGVLAGRRAPPGASDRPTAAFDTGCRTPARAGASEASQQR
jgi:hypothetical protein